MSNPPVKTLRMGALKAAIWKNVMPGNNFAYSVTFVRSYKVGEVWKESEGFGSGDLLELAKLADLAHTEIHRLRIADRKQTHPEGGGE